MREENKVDIKIAVCVLMYEEFIFHCNPFVRNFLYGAVYFLPLFP